MFLTGFITPPRSCQKDKVSTTNTDDYQQYLNEAEQRLEEADALAEQDVYVY